MALDDQLNIRVNLNAEGVTAGAEKAAAGMDELSASAAKMAEELKASGMSAAEALGAMTAAGVDAATSSQGVADAFGTEAASATEAADATANVAASADAAAASMGRLREGVAVTSTGLHGYLAGARNSMNAFAEAIGATMALHFADRTSEQVVQMSNLAATTGSTVAQLAEFRKVLEQNGVSGDALQNTLISLSSAMTKAAAGNKQAVSSFQELGIDTSNWAKHMPSAISVLLEMSDAMHNATNATQATGAAQQLLGFYGIHMISVMSQGGAAVRQAMQAMSGFGRATQDAVPAARNFERTWVGIKTQLDTGLLPTLGYVADALKIIDIVAETGFHVAASVVEGFVVDVEQGAEAVRGLGQELVDMTHGQFAAMKHDFDSTIASMKATSAGFAAAQKEMWDRVDRQIAGLGGTAASARGHLTLPGPIGKAGKTKSDKSYMHDQLMALRADDKLFADELRKDTDAINLAMAERVAAFEKSVSPITSAEAREATALFASMAKVREQREADQADAIAGARDAELRRVQAEQSTAAQQLALGEITKKQEIAEEEKFEQERYNVKRAALAKEQALLEQYAAEDPGNPKYVDQLKALHKQVETLEAQHQQTMTKLATKAAEQSFLPYKTMMADVDRAFASSIDGMIRGTQTFQMAMARMWQSILSEFLGSIEQMAVKWAEKQLEMLVIGAATNEKEVMGNAASAASGAAKSVAGIPIIGPELAAIESAATFAMTAGFAGSIPSAAGGWVVPSDTLAMVHEREMILPADISDRLREMTAGPGNALHVHYQPHVHGVDAQGVGEMLDRHADVFIGRLKKWARNMALY